MTHKIKPLKTENVEEKVRAAIERGKYIFTNHAFDRQTERMITLPETLHVLKTGYEEKRKSSFDINKNTWKYAIRGKTKRNELDVRVIVAFYEDQMLIITIMYIGEII